jgi:hypothetical protein
MIAHPNILDQTFAITFAFAEYGRARATTLP